MWASFPSQTESFRKFILEPTTFVAEESLQLLGFSGITHQGHVSSLYVHGNYHRQGIGSQILNSVIKYSQINGINPLHAEASKFSKPLFEKFGCYTYGEEQVVRIDILSR